MTDQEITDRLDRLESLIEQQAETIEKQQDQIERQAETIETQRERLAEIENDSGSSMPISRRGTMQAAGLLGLVGLGAGTASASPSGSVGTESTPVGTVFTDELDGPIADEAVEKLDGDGLEVDEGELQASGGESNWVETDIDGTDSLGPSDENINGIALDQSEDVGIKLDEHGDFIEFSLDTYENNEIKFESWDARFQVDVHVETLLADALDGDLTGNDEITNLVGPGLGVIGDELAAINWEFDEEFDGEAGTSFFVKQPGFVDEVIIDSLEIGEIAFGSDITDTQSRIELLDGDGLEVNIDNEFQIDAEKTAEKVAEFLTEDAGDVVFDPE